jgi:hypothetical protein
MPTSTGQAQYYVPFTKDSMRAILLYFMKLKSEAMAKQKGWVTMFEKHVKTRVKQIRSDNSREYNLKKSHAWFGLIRFQRELPVTMLT